MNFLAFAFLVQICVMGSIRSQRFTTGLTSEVTDIGNEAEVSMSPVISLQKVTLLKCT